MYSFIFKVVEKHLHIESKDLFEDDKSLLHVCIIEGVEGIQSRFCDDVVEENKCSED